MPHAYNSLGTTKAPRKTSLLKCTEVVDAVDSIRITANSFQVTI